MFEPVGARYDGPELEKEILELWRRENVFGRIMAEGASRPQFVFYEGPPTANGRPGIHHVLARTFKDLYPALQDDARLPLPAHGGLGHARVAGRARDRERARHLRQEAHRAGGRHREVHGDVPRVGDAPRRRMGSDDRAHGLLGRLQGRVLHAAQRLHRDGLGAPEGQLWDKRLIYQGYKVVPYDPRIGATLSSHEVAQGYREVEDPSVFVRFSALDERDTSFLVWTTTPWTLPSNLLLAVHPDVEYAWVKRGDETLILAQEPRARGAEGRAARDRAHRARPRARRHALRAAVRLSAGDRRPSRSACGPRSSSRPRTARASCTSRPRTARTT